VKRLCSVRQALTTLATLTSGCVFIEICSEMVKTDFERAQLKYYNFLRVNNEHISFDEDEQWLAKYYVRKVTDVMSFAVIPLSILVINLKVVHEVLVVCKQ